MNLESSLYRARVFHDRSEPKKHRFGYNVFLFYVELDELDELAKKYRLISRNRFNVFSFRDNDHLQFPIEKPDTAKPVKEQIISYLEMNGVTYDGGKIMLLTNFNVLGYNFNPVSFYFVFDRAEQPVCCVVEVQNTFREMKPFFLGKEQFDGKRFHLRTTKYFYVSPFIDHDAQFDFHLPVPGEQLGIGIDDFKDGKRFFISTLNGTKKKLTNGRLVGYALRFPFITLRIIALIHWQALKLWLKKIPYHKKDDHQDLQRDIYRKKENN
jgi:DUF1365 family protein